MTYSDVSSLKMNAGKRRSRLDGLRHFVCAACGAVLVGAAITPFLVLAMALSQGIVVI